MPVSFTSNWMVPSVRKYQYCISEGGWGAQSGWIVRAQVAAVTGTVVRTTTATSQEDCCKQSGQGAMGEHGLCCEAVRGVER